MATGPAAGLDARYARIGRAAFALARRICGDGAVAADVVEQAFASCGDGPDGGVGDGLLLRRVRDLACDRLRRAPLAPVALSDPPRELAELPAAHWRVLDLVALRGATVREAATRLRLTEDAVLAHLRDGLRQTGALLSGAGETDDHADSPRLALLR
jgi:DNA-directed RNA polymerase specialized sigma24 family protein